MTVETKDVAKIARLARIAVDDAGAKKIAGEFNQILSWIDQLQDIDTSAVAPMVGAYDDERATPRRDDKVTDGGQAEAVLQNAPGRMLEFFTVPKVVE